MRDFKELKVWQRAHKLAVEVYKSTANFPKAELFGLTSQIRRCAASIGANLAEGCGRQTDPEMGRFTQIAMGSGSELECHLLLAVELGFIKKPAADALLQELAVVRKMLSALSQAVRSSSHGRARAAAAGSKS